MRKTSGFTLIELMITLAVAAILASLAVPSFRSFLLNTRLTNAANEFAASVNIARSEAAKRGSTVLLSSVSSGSNWDSGWRVWVDEDGDGAYVAANDTQLYYVAPLESNMTLISTNSLDTFQYRPTGRVNNADILNLCDDRSGETGRKLEVNTIGRLTVTAKTCS